MGIQIQNDNLDQPDGNQPVVYLEDNRKPALYPANFGDCLGSGSINVTRFDAAYYQDNMTVLFHLAGNQSVVIGWTYGPGEWLGRKPGFR